MATEKPPELVSPMPGGNGHAAPGSSVKAGVTTLAFGSVGVVYGDIGTSPLYALRESLVHAKSSGASFAPDVIGIVSLLIWSLFLIVTIKYVLFVLRADNKGEGGTLSLMALAYNALGGRSTPVLILGVTGAALFAGDAIITPAISVLSAVEGLKIVTPLFEPYVVLITVIILFSLFMVQKRGTHRVASWFSPIMTVWFLTLAALGVAHIGDAPEILHAFNPAKAIGFLLAHGFLSFVVLGSVFLAVTGAEALYADMGHFGKKPIRYAWVLLVLPALVLNYLGQGAMLIGNPATLENPFFLMAPDIMRLPLVILATLATVIASQAVITGAYSLARQAIQLGFLPRLEIQHTSDQQEGQIYVPKVNFILLAGVLFLVLVFGSSSKLASAYGIAVSASMIVDSCLVFFIFWKLWRWPLWISAVVVASFLTLEIAFFSSNLLKLVEGGYVPVLIGIAMITIMWTWRRGSKILENKTRRSSIPTTDLIRMLQKSKPTRVPGTAIFLTSTAEAAPTALMHNLKHNKVLHERVLIVSVATENTPRVNPSKRSEIERLSEDFTIVRMHFGFMESPRVPAALAELRKQGLKFDIMTTSFFLGRRTLKASSSSGMPAWQDKLYIALSRQSANATNFFSIPSDRVVELGAQVTV